MPRPYSSTTGRQSGARGVAARSPGDGAAAAAADRREGAPVAVRDAERAPRPPGGDGRVVARDLRVERPEHVRGVADGGGAAVEPAVGPEGPLLLRGGAGVEVRRGQLARLGEVADAVEARPVEAPQDRVRLRQLDVARPELDPIEQRIPPLPAGASEELVVPPDLGLEARRRQIEPAPSRRRARRAREASAGSPDPRRPAGSPGSPPARARRCRPRRARRCRARSRAGGAGRGARLRAVERDLDLLHRPGGEQRAGTRRGRGRS